MSTSKRASLGPFGPVSSALKCSDKPGPPAKGAFSLPEDKRNDGARRENREQGSLDRVVEDFFWIGSCIMAFSKWRLGYMGKLRRLERLAWNQPAGPVVESAGRPGW